MKDLKATLENREPMSSAYVELVLSAMGDVTTPKRGALSLMKI